MLIIILKNNHRVHGIFPCFWCRRELGGGAMASRVAPSRRVASVRRSPLVGTFQIGYVPLVDAAPLLVAEALGLYAKRGLAVDLSAELGWGSIREKVVYGELDAAHAPGPLLFSIILGTHSRACAAATDLVLNLQGNAITLSRRFWDRGVRDVPTFKVLLRSEAPHKPAFAVVARFSSHHFLLRTWLRSAGLDPDRDIRIVVLPPPLLVDHMRDGQVDGFCAGEPWNSAAALSGEGWVIATSISLAPRHPEKILLVRSETLHRQPEAYSALRDAVLEACRFCDQTENRQAVVDILHGSHVFPVPKQVLMNSLVGPFNTGIAELEGHDPFVIFHRNGANDPTRERAQWCLQAVIDAGALVADGAVRKLCLDAFLDQRDPDCAETGPGRSHFASK
jgi:ABC-type nitrate/sulfonate/bicarbonate transport system substrate-binding protein